MTNPFPQFQQPAITVDLAMVAVIDGGLMVLLKKRPDAAQVGGEWALPGGFVHVDKSLEETAGNVLVEKANIASTYLEQLATFGALNRDPRGRVVTVAYFALLGQADIEQAVNGKDDLAMALIQTPWDGEQGGKVYVLDDSNNRLALAFDHAEILGTLIKRLRGKLDYTKIAFEFLPAQFTLREVQEVHEAILGRKLTKPAFRRKLLDRGLLKPTGKREAASAFRPAELFEKID